MDVKEYLKKTKISNLPVKKNDMDRIIEDNIRVMNGKCHQDECPRDDEACPECRLFTIEKQGRCSTCRNCGWSKCQ
ncbi:hypothetical protein AGMMS49573_07940 [Endomicrobiia bacterium]|nr:hypothetical protein AGMMS49573_07940 [Endomicrobiia bacterium]